MLYGVQGPTIQSKQSDSCKAGQCWAGGGDTIIQEGKKTDTFGHLPRPGLGNQLRDTGPFHGLCIHLGWTKETGPQESSWEAQKKQGLRSLWMGKNGAEGKMPAALLES